MRWDGTVRPNVLNAATRFWLEQNLRPLVGHVDAVALYGLFSNTYAATLSECAAISSHILKEFRMRVVWMDPELQVDSLSNVPSWIFASAPVLMRYGHGSRLEQVLLSASSPVSGAEMHLVLSPEDAVSSPVNLIFGRFGSDHAALPPLRFGTSIGSRSGGFIITKLACDARTLSGTISSSNGYLSSQAKGSKSIHPSVRISCALGFRPPADAVRAYVPSWWITSTSPSGCVDQAAAGLVVANWSRESIQADLQVPSPYGTVGAEKAADMAFDLGLTLGALSHGAASSMRSNGLSISFEHFGTPLSSGYCDAVTEYELSCYPFLCNHPDDAVSSFADPDSGAVVFASNPYATPFVAAGVAQTSEWIYLFQRRWSLRSNMRLALSGSDPFVPWISLISFEPTYYASSEHAVHEPYKGIEGGCHAGSAVGGFWPGVEADSRFSREVLAGLPFSSLKDAFGSASTRCDVVGKDGSPQGVYSPSDVDYQNDAKNHAPNRAFSIWFDGVSRQIVLGAINAGACDVLRTRFTECKFIAPSISSPQNASIPKLDSAFVADTQGVAYSPMLLGSYSPAFNYINIAQFANSLISRPSDLPHGGLTSYEVNGDAVLRDGSNRSDWIVASDGRGVVLGNPTMAISNSQYISVRSAMSSLHAKSIIRYLRRSSEVDFTAICMPLLGLQPKGGTGDVRLGESRPLSSGYANTLYALSESDFLAVLRSREEIVIYDLDQSRSKAEWDKLMSALVYAASPPVPSTGSIELPAQRQASVGFVGYGSIPSAVGVNMKVSGSGGLVSFVDSQGRELLRRNVKSKTFGDLADEVAPFGIDVKIDPQDRSKALSVDRSIDLTIPKDSSRPIAVMSSSPLLPEASARIEIYLTSPDPLQPSRVSRGGYPSSPISREVGKLNQGIGMKDTSARTDAPPFSKQVVMIGKEMVETSCAGGLLSISKRYSPSVHRQGEVIRSVNGNMFDPLSTDGKDIVRCIALVNSSSQVASGKSVLTISGMPDGGYAFLESPNRQGFLFDGTAVVGTFINGVSKPHSMRSGDAIAEWPADQNLGRHLVSAMSGDRLELSSRPASVSRTFWCIPSASRMNGKAVSDLSNNASRVVASDGSVRISIPPLAAGEVTYCWISVPKMALGAGSIGFAVKSS